MGHICRNKGSTRPPKKSTRQGEADALVAEAVSDALARGPFSPVSMRQNVIRVMAEMYYVCGTMYWPRGWVRALMVAMAPHGLDTTQASMRWYRNSLKDNPIIYEGVPHINSVALEGLMEEVC